MSRRSTLALALAAACAATACSSLAPGGGAVPEARPDVPPTWDAAATTGADAELPDWRGFLADPRLVQLVERALARNRDLRSAVLQVERARALHAIQGAARVPSVGAAAQVARSGGDDRATSGSYGVSVGVTDYELDLWGRVRQLDEAALQRLFAQQQARATVQISLVAEVANAWLALAADQRLLQLARATQANRLEQLQLAVRRHELGAISALELVQTEAAVETARADVARFEGQVAADRHALALLVGTPVEAALQPDGWDAPVSTWAGPPAGLPSSLLLRRPDVRRAEHQLQAAQADIGAARAAFFPTLRLTGSAGTASTELSGLFSRGSFVWSVLPQLSVPIFTGGRLDAQLAVAQVDRDLALAQYERAIQSGFREVADALVRRETLAGQRAAQQALLQAATRAERLARARHDAGRDSYLVLLDAQRTRVAAEQSLVATELAEQANRVALYRALGGGWQDGTP